MQAPLLGTLVVTSPFGPRGAVTLPSGEVLAAGHHDGVDYRAAVGTPVVAPTDLRVTRMNTTTRGGLQVFVETLDGRFRFAFVHLDTAVANVGDVVGQGSIVARSGNSGGVAPHLHVEARDLASGELVDPHTLWGAAAPVRRAGGFAVLAVAGALVVGGALALLALFGGKNA